MAQESPPAPRARVGWRARSTGPFGLSRDNTWLALSTLLYGASVGFYQYVLPLYLEQLGASPDQVGLGLAIGNSGAVVGLLVGGILVNRYGLRRQILASWGLTVAAGMLLVAAGSWQIAALGLLLTTLSLFGIPAYNAYIVLARGRQGTAEALTLVYVSFNLGSVVTPALGGWIIAVAGMRAMFGASLVCIVASTLVTIPISERQPEVAVSQAVALSGRRNRLTGLFQSYVDALGDPPLRRLLALFAGMYLATFVGVSLMPNYLHDRLGMDTAAIGVLGTGAAIVGVAGSLGLVRLVRPLGEYRALALGQGALVAGFGLALLAPSVGSLALLAGGAGFALRGGLSAQQAIARAMVPAVAVGQRLGPAFALQSILYNGATALGPALAGILYARDAALPLAAAFLIGLPYIIWLGLAGPARVSKPELEQSR